MVDRFGTLSPALVFCIGPWELLASELTTGGIVGFMVYAARMCGPASQLINVHIELLA